MPGLADWFYDHVMEPIERLWTVDYSKAPALTANNYTYSLPKYKSDSKRETVVSDVISQLDQYFKGNSFWEKMTEGEKKAILSGYTKNDSDSLYNYWDVDTDALMNDVLDASEMLNAQDYNNLTPPDDKIIAQELLDSYYQPLYNKLDEEASNYKTVYDDYFASENAARTQREQVYQDLLNRLDAEQTSYTTAYDQMLDALAQEQEATKRLYADQLQMSADSYNRNVDMLMGNQMRQNAMIQDTLRSDLSRTRQNALEAGASAGLRIAGNINATLAAQNKAAQSSLETSNNLAQMLLNQRQAAAGLRSEYQGYLSNSNRYRNSLQSGQLDRLSNTNAQRSAAASDYGNWLYNSNQNLANAASRYQSQLSDINSRRASAEANYRNERANEINYQTGVYEDALANAENRIKSRFDNTPISGYVSSRLRSNIYK